MWERLKPVLRRIPGAVATRGALRRVFRLVASPGYREAERLSRTGRAGLFQPWNTTDFNRYPDLFSWLRETFAGIPAPRILSFGCSTGEEIVTIKTYLPHALVIGVDINRNNLIEAATKTRCYGDTVHLKEASSLRGEPSGHYDVILCLTVLINRKLRVEQPADCSEVLPFAQFESAVTDFARCLKPGGYLVIHGSNFNFLDTAISARFERAAFQPEPKPTPAPAYSAGNRLVPGVVYRDAIFRKHAAP